jgi:hypothetical protein
MNPRGIMILLAAPRRQSYMLHAALDAVEVAYAAIREGDVAETDGGRAAYAMLAIVCEPEHYIAHRTLLGVRKGVLRAAARRSAYHASARRRAGHR